MAERHWSTVLVMSSVEVHAGTIRRYYEQWRLEHGLPHRCDLTGCMFHTQPLVWNGEPLPLILDHISGNNCDNLPSNLRFAAPLVRIDPGLLVRNDPPLGGVVFGDRGCRREEETSLLEVSALVSA